MGIGVRGTSRPSFLLILFVAGAAFAFHHHRAAASAQTATWNAGAAPAHTASVPFFVSPANLEFHLDEAQAVEIGVYSASGQPVRHFPAATFAVGENSVTWDGVDDEGRQVLPGFYLARFTFGGAWDTRRLMWFGGMH
jgi:FlgD Ig-like domain